MRMSDELANWVEQNMPGQIDSAYNALAEAPTVADAVSNLSADLYRLHDKATLARLSAVALTDLARHGAARQTAPPGLVDNYVNGASVRELAARYGVARKTIRQWIDQAGVPRRDISGAMLEVWAQKPIRLCSVDGCDGRHVARGLCGRHYQQRATPS